MSGLINFNFEDKELRSVFADGHHWFVVKDVLNAIESSTKLSDVCNSIIERLGDEFVSDRPILDSMNREQIMKCIRIEGVTYMVSKSNTDAGKRLDVKIHTEILPSIHKTGSYSVVEDQTPGWFKSYLENKERIQKETDLKFEKLLGKKTENEQLGQELKVRFINVVNFLEMAKGQSISELDLELLEQTYNSKRYLSLQEIVETFRPHYKDIDKKGCVYFKCRHSIGKTFSKLTCQVLPKDSCTYIFDKINCIYALWELDSIAKEIGLFKTEEQQLEISLENLVRHFQNQGFEVPNYPNRV